MSRWRTQETVLNKDYDGDDDEDEDDGVEDDDEDVGDDDYMIMATIVT